MTKRPSIAEAISAAEGRLPFGKMYLLSHLSQLIADVSPAIVCSRQRPFFASTRRAVSMNERKFFAPTCSNIPTETILSYSPSISR